VKDFNNAFLAAQRHMPTIKKTSDNPHFKSKFADFVELVEKVKPVLNAHGLYFLHTVSSDIDGNNIVVSCEVIHAESGQSKASSVSWRPEKNTAQSVGSLITYMKRYTLQAMCGVAADDEDDDGHSAGAKSPVNANLYLGTPQQKRDLVALCSKLGLKDIETIKDISKLSEGIALAELESFVTSRIELLGKEPQQ